jgi:hypothetical protein
MKLWISWSKHQNEHYKEVPYISEAKPDKIKVSGFARFYQMTTDNYSRIETSIAEKLGVKEGECIEFNIERVES